MTRYEFTNSIGVTQVVSAPDMETARRTLTPEFRAGGVQAYALAPAHTGAMTPATMAREIHATPTPSPESRAVDLTIAALSAPKSARGHVSYQHTGFELGAL